MGSDTRRKTPPAHSQKGSTRAPENSVIGKRYRPLHISGIFSHPTLPGAWTSSPFDESAWSDARAVPTSAAPRVMFQMIHRAPGWDLGKGPGAPKRRTVASVRALV